MFLSLKSRPSWFITISLGTSSLLFSTLSLIRCTGMMLNHLSLKLDGADLVGHTLEGVPKLEFTRSS
jgi:hypothetical protein